MMTNEFLRAAADAVLDTIADDCVDALHTVSAGGTVGAQHHLGHAAEGIITLTNILRDEGNE